MFDPFEKRASRDIRNQLAESFLTALKTHSPLPIQQTADALKKKAPDPDHINYIDDRFRRYTLIFEDLRTTEKKTGHSPDPFYIAGFLWNRQLFFECHEWLEPFWKNARGSHKKAVQGLIRAAGVFVFLEAGRKNAADSSALKALALIRKVKEDIPLPFSADQLVKALETSSPGFFKTEV